VLRTDFVNPEYKEQYRLHPGDKLFMVRFYVEEARCDNEYRFFETAMRNVIVPEIAGHGTMRLARVQKILKRLGDSEDTEQQQRQAIDRLPNVLLGKKSSKSSGHSSPQGDRVPGRAVLSR